MRRWTFILLVMLFVGLAVAVILQFTVGHKPVRCPGPGARFGGPHSIVKCAPGTPTK